MPVVNRLWPVDLGDLKATSLPFVASFETEWFKKLLGVRPSEHTTVLQIERS